MPLDLPPLLLPFGAHLIAACANLDLFVHKVQLNQVNLLLSTCLLMLLVPIEFAHFLSFNMKNVASCSRKIGLHDNLIR